VRLGARDWAATHVSTHATRVTQIRHDRRAVKFPLAVATSTGRQRRWYRPRPELLRGAARLSRHRASASIPTVSAWLSRARLGGVSLKSAVAAGE
jgi:hypothetical protein